MRSGNPKIDITERLFQKALAQQKNAGSDAYRRGIMAALAYRSTGIKVSLNCPYALGSADFEVFMAGADAGHKTWLAYEEKQKLKQKK